MHLSEPGAGAEEWSLLARIQLGLGDPKAAAAAAGRAVALDPDHPYGHQLVAVALLRGGRRHELQSAERAARRAVQLVPDSATTLLVLAEALRLRRRLAEATEVAMRNIRVNPGSALAWQSAALVALARRKWELAEELARRGLSIDPLDHELMIALSQALSGQGRKGAAGDLAVAAINARPDDPEGRSQLERVIAPVGLGGLGLAYLVLQVIGQVGNRGPAGAFLDRNPMVGRIFGLLVVALLVVALGYMVVYRPLQRRRHFRSYSPVVQAAVRRQRRTDRVGWWVLLGAAVATVVACAVLVALTG